MKTIRSLFAVSLVAACAAPPPPPPASAPAPAPPPVQSPSFDPPSGVFVPVGTRLLVRMQDSVNTRQHRAGHRFTMVLEGDLVAEGQTVAPRGSLVYGIVADATSSRRVAGSSSLTLVPTDLSIGGRLVPIRTSQARAVAAQSAGQRTVGRTARGAALGGLAGGSSGARTGAKIGLGASILSDDGQIQVASGTLLEFELVDGFAI